MFVARKPVKEITRLNDNEEQRLRIAAQVKKYGGESNYIVCHPVESRIYLKRYIKAEEVGQGTTFAGQYDLATKYEAALARLIERVEITDESGQYEGKIALESDERQIYDAVLDPLGDTVPVDFKYCGVKAFYGPYVVLKSGVEQAKFFTSVKGYYICLLKRTSLRPDMTALYKKFGCHVTVNGRRELPGFRGYCLTVVKPIKFPKIYRGLNQNNQDAICFGDLPETDKMMKDKLKNIR